MTGIKDRHGRGLSLTVYGADGAERELGAAALEAALRLKRALAGKPELCAGAVKKYSGWARSAWGSGSGTGKR